VTLEGYICATSDKPVFQKLLDLCHEHTFWRTEMDIQTLRPNRVVFKKTLAFMNTDVIQD